MAAVINALSSCASDGEAKTVGCSQFEEMIQTTPQMTLLDVRTPEEYGAGHIPGAVNINFYDDDFAEQVEKEIPVSSPLAIYCKSGRRSAEASKVLAGKGYCGVGLEGGILDWEKTGLSVTNDRMDLYTTPSGKSLAIESLIHASVRIVFDGKEIEIDPVGKMGDRITDYSKFPKADLILVTHEHYDHLDPEAIKVLSKPDTVVIANPNSADILGYGEVMRNGDRKVLADGIEIEAVPAYNVSPDKLQFHPKGRDNGYVLTLGGMKVYIAGDTEVIPEMEALKDIDIAFLPCNLPYTMTPAQLIDAAKIIRPKVLYPYHYGTTDLSSVAPALAPEGIYVRILPFDPGSK